jgi:hypothetical protein
VRSCEYEDWPRGRIVFNRARDLLAVAPQCEPWIFLSLDDGLLADYSVFRICWLTPLFWRAPGVSDFVD